MEFKDVKTALEGKLTELKSAVDATDIQIDGANVVINEDQYKGIVDLQNEVKRLRGLASTFGEVKAIKAWLEAPDATARTFQDAPAEVKDIASLLVESDEFKDMRARGAYTMSAPIEVERANITDGFGYKAAGDPLYTGLPYAAGTQSVRNVGTVVQNEGMLAHIKQPQRVRDLFPKASTSANLIEYFKTLGLVENGGRGNAAPVPEVTGTSPDLEFGLKPKSSMSFAQDQAPVRTIAHWMPVHRNALADVPQLKSIITDELMYGLALEEDRQLLSGNGVGENLRGLLNTPGIQTQPQGVGDNKADAVRRAMTKSALAMFPATGVILHPNDWEDIELTKATGDGQYMVAQNVVVGAQSRLWRLPVVETPVMSEGKFLVGAFGQAAKIYDRERATLRIAEQHEDFFVRNAAVLLVEERIAVVVPRPESIVLGTFS